MSEQNVALAREMYEAFARGDVPAVLGGMAEDIEWYEAEGLPYGGLYSGPQAVAENVFAPVVHDIEGFTVTPEEFYADGDQVIVVVRYTGKGAVTGKPLDVPAAHIITVGDGKIARFRQFVDSVTFNAVLPEAAKV
jgi:ketosteroid isomerase-like protein